jgi:hypothetical protein
MKGKTAPLSVSLALSLLVPLSALLADTSETGTLDARAAFGLLKTLEGEWEGTADSRDGEPVHIQYRVTAAGSAVMETLFPGTAHEMVTVYHMDGEDLMLTHYCAIGNQPRMKFEKTDRPRTMTFAFAGGTNMASDQDMHMHEATIRIIDNDTIEANWTSSSKGETLPPKRFFLARKN